MSAADDEHQALQEAIRNSLIERRSATATQFGDPASTSAHKPNETPPRRANIEDRIQDLALQSALELPLLNDPWGDTWVFIDPPPKQPEQDEVDYARYIKRYERPTLVKKDALLRYHSPDATGEFNLEALFGPSAQFRTIRRRKLTARLREQPNIKYVIDLTPPAEGENAVYLTTELCCSDGVRLWYQASDIWSVSKILVGGNEEYASVKRHKLSPYSPSAIEDFSNPGTGRPSTSTPTNILMPLEYTPIRHRSAIERVIAALTGHDPKLDSAPKMWTTFAVAKYLGIAKSPVTDYIIRWLRAYPNSFFLEVCPEVSLRIADGLENHDLARDTFAILVGEEALDSLVRARSSYKAVRSQHSTYGRRKEDLPEEFCSRIEYASKRFIERIRNDFFEFTGEEMKWVEDLPEFQKLLSITHPALSEIVDELTSLLKKYVRGTLMKLLFVNYDYVPAPDFHGPGGEELIQRRSRGHVWATLTYNERILSRTYWLALVSFELFKGPSNFDVRQGWGMDGGIIEPSFEVRIRELNSLIQSGNRLLAEAVPLPVFELPDRTRGRANPNAPHFRYSSNDPIQPVVGVYNARSASPRESAKTSKPTVPVDIPQATSDLKRQFQFDPELLRINRRVCHEEGTRRPFPDDRVNTTNTRLTSDSPRSDQSVPKTYNQTEWPLPQRRLSWSDHDTADLLPVSERYTVESEEPDGRDTPPFFREDFEGQTLSQWDEQAQLDERLDSAPCRPDIIDLREFFVQANAAIEDIARHKLRAADYMMREEPHEIGITNTLVCLEDSEWKYLPLWAGGYDDETGGVYEDQLPAAHLGFTTPGPGIHTGTTPGNSTATSSEFEMVRDEYGAETVNTSMDNNESFPGALKHERIYAADSVDLSSSDDFTMISANEEAEEEDARKHMEAQEQVEAAEERATREARRIASLKQVAVDENYADLFEDCEDDGDTDIADDGDSVMCDDWEDEDTVLV